MQLDKSAFLARFESSESTVNRELEKINSSLTSKLDTLPIGSPEIIPLHQKFSKDVKSLMRSFITAVAEDVDLYLHTILHQPKVVSPPKVDPDDDVEDEVPEAVEVSNNNNNNVVSSGGASSSSGSVAPKPFNRSDYVYIKDRDGHPFSFPKSDKVGMFNFLVLHGRAHCDFAPRCLECIDGFISSNKSSLQSDSYGRQFINNLLESTPFSCSNCTVCNSTRKTIKKKQENEGRSIAWNVLESKPSSIALPTPTLNIITSTTTTTSITGASALPVISNDNNNTVNVISNNNFPTSGVLNTKHKFFFLTLTVNPDDGMFPNGDRTGEYDYLVGELLASFFHLSPTTKTGTIKCVARCYSIERTQSGTPHLHALVRFNTTQVISYGSNRWFHKIHTRADPNPQLRDMKCEPLTKRHLPNVADIIRVFNYVSKQGPVIGNPLPDFLVEV